MKDSYPVDLAEYAITESIAHEPAFAWWVPYTIKKRNQIISKLKFKYLERTHKYGLEIPKNVEHAKHINGQNGNTLWKYDINKEMDNVRIAFELHDGNQKELIGFHRVAQKLS